MDVGNRFIDQRVYTERQPWIRRPLSHTAARPNAPSIWRGILGDLSLQSGATTSLAMEPPQSISNRSRSRIWACDGNLSPLDEHSARPWRVAIVLSYPVNQRHFALNTEGSQICLTLRHVLNRLPKIAGTNQLVFITDIFPYVGHASALGRQLVDDNIAIRSMEIQAHNILFNLRPPLIIVATEAARFAFHRTCRNLSARVIDITESLGVPASFC